MKIVVLTSDAKGTASRVLPALAGAENVEVTSVILANGVSSNKKRTLKKKIIKTYKIGLMGALNGIRMRDWYANNDVDSIQSVCKSKGVELLETPYINCEGTRELLKGTEADLGVSLGNGYIGEKVYSIPKYGMVNLHTEILPEFRGAQSIIWPIFEGSDETGFTIHQIDNKIDTGNILFQKKNKIKFYSSISETVKKNLSITRSQVPEACAYVCQNYLSLKDQSKPQSAGKSYTTPSIWEFLRMWRNNKIMYKKIAQCCLNEL